MKIAYLLEQFCSESLVLGNRSEATIEWYETALKAFLRRMPHVENIEQFNTENIRTFLYDGRLQRKWKTRTFLGYYGAFRGFLNWCVRKKHIVQNPIYELEKPKLEKTLPRSISRDDAQKVLEYAFHQRTCYRFMRYRNRAIFATMLFSGLRVKELLNLKLHDVDLQNGSIFVSCGKGAKDRMIPICQKLKFYLDEYLKERNRLKRENERFFTSGNGDVPLTYHGLKRVLDYIRKKSGLTFTNHGLRHTFATLMLEGGCNIYALSKMLGHSDIKTTTIYLSASAEHLRDQMVKHPLNF